MEIGVINAGNIGSRLTRAWVRAGHTVMVSKDGDRAKLDPLVKELDGKVAVGTLAEAAAFGDVLLFSVYWPRFNKVLAEVGPLRGKVVIDTMNPLNVDENFNHTHDFEFMKSSSTAEELQRRNPEAKVVKAFSTIPAGLLDRAVWGQQLPAGFYCGDDVQAKRVVAQLVGDFGLPPVDVGPLSSARLLETLGVLLHQVEVHHGGSSDGHMKHAFTVLKAGG